MSNSYPNFDAKNSKVVSFSTETLKNRLNQLYQTRRHSQDAPSHDGLFEFLWDLKEKALLEGKSEVEVPASLLDDLENAYHAESGTGSRTRH